MKNILIIALVFVGYNTIAQEKGNFTFEIDASRIHYHKMEVYNRYLRDTTDVTTSHFGDTYLKDTLTASFIFGASLSYQPTSFMDFGIYGAYQGNQFGREYQQQHYVGGPPSTFILADHKVKIANHSYIVGISSTVYLNRILHFENYESKFINRFQIGIGLKVGYAFSSIEQTDWIDKFELLTPGGIQPIIKSTSLKGSARNWSGNIELKLGYRFVEKSYFSGVGIKVGYQFHSSSALRNDANAAFQFGASKEEMRLNLSGFYYGIYLNVGKK